MLVQRSTEGNIDQLTPIADPEDRKIPLEGPLDEEKIASLFFRVKKFRFRMLWLAPSGGIDIGPAGKKEAVKAFQITSDLASRPEKRKKYRSTPRGPHGLDVEPIQLVVNGVALRDEFAINPDQRTLHHIALYQRNLLLSSWKNL